MARTTQLALLTTVSFALIVAIGPGTATGSSLRLAQRLGRAGILPLEAGAIPGAQPASQDQSSSTVLTNADVIKMVRAHLSTDIIVGQIQSSPCRFSLSTASLIGLKQAGVPDRVISAMQAKNAGATAPSSSQGSPRPNQPTRPVDVPAGNGGSPTDAARPAGTSPAANAVPASTPGLVAPFGGVALDALAYGRLGEADKLALSLIRSTPHLLDDDEFLRAFVILNNCANPNFQIHLGNEFDYPQIARFYKEKAQQILADIPSEITLQETVSIGDYNVARGAFPVIRREPNLSQADFATGVIQVRPISQCMSQPFNFDIEAGSPAKFRRFWVQVAFKPVVLQELQMSESDARQFIAYEEGIGRAPSTGLPRVVYLTTQIQISQSPPKITIEHLGAGRKLDDRTIIEFSGQIKEITVTKASPAVTINNAPIAILHLEDNLVSGRGGNNPRTASSNAPAPGAPNSVPHSGTLSADPPPFGLGRLDRDGYDKLSVEALVCLAFIRLTPHALDDDLILRNFAFLNNLGNREARYHIGSEFDRAQVLSYYKSHAGEILAGPFPPMVLTGHTIIGLGEYDISRKAFPAHGGGTSLGTIKIPVDTLGDGGITRFSRSSPIVSPGYQGGNLEFAASFAPVTIDWIPVSEEDARRYVESAGHDRALDVEIKVEILQQRPNIGFSPSNVYNGGVTFAAKVLSVKVFDRIKDASGQKGHLFATLVSETDSPRTADVNATSTAPLPQQGAASPQDSGKTSLGARLKEMDREHNIQRCNSGVAVACDELGNSYKKDSEKSADRESDLATALQYYQKACSMGFQGGCRHANSLAQGEPKK